MSKGKKRRRRKEENEEEGEGRRSSNAKAIPFRDSLMLQGRERREGGRREKERGRMGIEREGGWEWEGGREQGGCVREGDN